MAYLWIVNPNSKYNSGVQTTANDKFPFYVDYTGEQKETRKKTENGTLEITYEWIGRKTLKEYLQEHPNYKVCNTAKIDKLLDESAENMCFTWHEIDYDNYMEMLEVLPPLRWESNSFFICEADTQDVHSFFCKRDGKYYTTKARLSHNRENILANLETAISNNEVKK